MNGQFGDGERERQDGAAEEAEQGAAMVACPGCGAEVPEDTVVCCRCGWNFASGKKTEVEEDASRRQRNRARAAKWILGVAAAVAVAAAALWALHHLEKVGSGVERAEAWVGVESGKTRERRAREWLDRKYPAWRAGDTVRLEKTNGDVLEGVLSGVEDGVATVETDGGPKMVGVGSLDGRSRVRVDERYREGIIRMRRDNP